jgi:uncharacterized protein with HEPN domain
MLKSELEYLRHIKKECDFLLETSKNLIEEDFYKDEILKRAFTRCLEIIGEASKRVDLDFRLKYNAVPWSDMAKTSDKIIHHYEGVDYELVWEIITTEIPGLHFQIELILKEHNK